MQQVANNKLAIGGKVDIILSPKIHSLHDIVVLESENSALKLTLGPIIRLVLAATFFETIING